jgi:hypothetical protein
MHSDMLLVSFYPYIVLFSSLSIDNTMEALVAEPGVEGKESKNPTKAVAHVLTSPIFFKMLVLYLPQRKSGNGGDPTCVRELEVE